MRKLLALAMVTAAFSAAPVFAADLTIQPHVAGSGVPGTTVPTKANPELPYGVFYAPQYLPNHPTAATIWPRVVEVDCMRDTGGNFRCEGYNWTPDMGRAEYLWVKPKFVETVPVVIPRTVKKIGE